MSEHETPTEAKRWEKWANRTAVAVIAAGLLVVVVAPAILSARDLATWGHERLGLTSPWTWVVPIALDAAALVCVGLTFHATLKAESAGAARLLVWVLAAASSLANWRQGRTVSMDAAVFFGGMPWLAAVLLDVTLRRIRRTVLSGIGAVERPLPRYRAARWVVTPAGTFRAWKAAVIYNITDPDQALAASGQLPPQGGPGAPLPPSGTEGSGDPIPATLGDAQGAPALPAGPPLPEGFAQWTKKEQIRHALDQPDVNNGGDAHAWLAQRGFTVNSNYAYTVAAAEARRVQVVAQHDDDAPEGPDTETTPERPTLAAVASDT